MPVPSSRPLDSFTAMSERELIFIARKKGHPLSPSAFAQLKKEFARREMDDAPIRFWEGQTIKEQALALNKRSGPLILKGAVFIIAGVVAAPIVASSSSLPTTLLSVPIIYGAIDVYTGFSNRKKCKDILENIQIEERYRTEV